MSSSQRSHSSSTSLAVERQTTKCDEKPHEWVAVYYPPRPQFPNVSAARGGEMYGENNNNLWIHEGQEGKWVGVCVQEPSSASNTTAVPPQNIPSSSTNNVSKRVPSSSSHRVNSHKQHSTSKSAITVSTQTNISEPAPSNSSTQTTNLASSSSLRGSSTNPFATLTRRLKARSDPFACSIPQVSIPVEDQVSTYLPEVYASSDSRETIAFVRSHESKISREHLTNPFSTLSPSWPLSTSYIPSSPISAQKRIEVVKWMYRCATMPILRRLELNSLDGIFHRSMVLFDAVLAKSCEMADKGIALFPDGVIVRSPARRLKGASGPNRISGERHLANRRGSPLGYDEDPTVLGERFYKRQHRAQSSSSSSSSSSPIVVSGSSYSPSILTAPNPIHTLTHSSAVSSADSNLSTPVDLNSSAHNNYNSNLPASQAHTPATQDSSSSSPILSLSPNDLLNKPFSNPIDLEEIYAIGAMCTLLVIKVEEESEIEGNLSLINRFLRKSSLFPTPEYTTPQVNRLEKAILSVLNWRVGVIWTAYDLLSFFLLEDNEGNFQVDLRRTAKATLRTLHDYYPFMSTHPPTLVALACIYHARRVHDKQPLWSLGLECAGISKEKVSQCTKEIEKILMRHSRSSNSHTNINANAMHPVAITQLPTQSNFPHISPLHIHSSVNSAYLHPNIQLSHRQQPAYPYTYAANNTSAQQYKLMGMAV